MNSLKLGGSQSIILKNRAVRPLWGRLTRKLQKAFDITNCNCPVQGDWVKGAVESWSLGRSEMRGEDPGLPLSSQQGSPGHVYTHGAMT